MFDSFHTFHKSLLTYTLLIDFKEEINNILSKRMGCKSSYIMTLEYIDGVEIQSIWKQVNFYEGWLVIAILYYVGKFDY